MATINENNNDASAGTGTQYSISLDDVFQGTFDTTADVDWVRVELTAETIYDISRTTGEDIRLSLFDSEGNRIISGHSRPAGEKIIFSPDESGTYYIGIHNNNNEASGEYEISLIENTIPIGTYDELADYLTDGWWEDNGSISHSFDIETGGVLTANITALNEDGQRLARWALEAWTYVTGITFELVEDDSAFITFDDTGEGDGYAATEKVGGVITSATVIISADTLPVLGTTLGSWSFFAYMHEIGHSLGLGHTKPESAAKGFGNGTLFLIDSFQASMMSGFFASYNTYINDSAAHPVTPMIADIIAIQNLYGVPEDSNGGDTIYGYQSNVGGYLGEFFRLWTGETDPFILVDVPDAPLLALHTLASADLDGDGDPDMVIANHRGDFHYFENTGTATNPAFTLRTGISNPLDTLVANFDSTPTFTDLDGDGDLDLVNGSKDGAIAYIENTVQQLRPFLRDAAARTIPLMVLTRASAARPHWQIWTATETSTLSPAILTVSLPISRIPARLVHPPSQNAPVRSILWTASARICTAHLSYPTWTAMATLISYSGAGTAGLIIMKTPVQRPIPHSRGAVMLPTPLVP